MSDKCAIIGAGIAGIATAIRLTARGITVEVYEANDYAGGKFREMHRNGYRFDMGPSVFTLPALIDELFELHGRNPRDYFTYTALENPFKYFFEDGSTIEAFRDVDKFAEEIERKTIDKKETFYQYLKDIAAKYDITNEVFIENSLHIPKNFMKWKAVSGVFNFPKIDAFRTMNKVNKAFFKDPRLVQVFNNYATYVGSNPMVAPGTLNVIQHLEINLGMYMPDKGMFSLTQALAKLASDVGVKFHFNSPVEAILTNGDAVRGIQVKGEALAFDHVVSNMDIFFTYKKLLKDRKPPRRILNQPKSSSVIVFYWGIKKEFPNLGIHNMLFTQAEAESYRRVFDAKDIHDDPSVYIYITGKHVKEDAPPGCENWFVMVVSPHNAGQEWPDLVKRTRKNVVDKINRMLHTDIEQHIEMEEAINPVWIEHNFSNAYGAIFGNSSNSKFSAFLRHPNFSRKIKGLYFAGGSVHPGAGIPMCLNSAKIVDRVFG